MATDALTYSILTKEIKDLLQGGKITKIIQPERDEVLLNIYNDRKNYKLVLSVNPTVCRMHITEFDFKSSFNSTCFLYAAQKIPFECNNYRCNESTL
jgi:Predicted RNA-binding protein homologous to eukaryotic snRNP